MSAATQRYDLNTQRKLSTFTLARLILLTIVLFGTIFLKQEVLGASVILHIYAALAASFFFSLVNVSAWEETLKVRFFMPSQLLYDLLFTSYLVYLTGVNDSIFLVLYLLNIVFASVVYQLHGALFVAFLSGSVYAFIYYANVDATLIGTFFNLAYNELLFLLTALLCGQLMDEIKKQRALLETQKTQLARLEMLNDRLLNSIPLGIVTVDREEYVLSVNRTALSLLSIEHPPEMRIKYYELLPDLRGILEAWPKMTETQRLRFLFKHGRSAGAQFSFNLVEMNDATTGLESEKLRYILVFEDVSKMLELEKKLELESRLAATGELAAGIAHEIRNPLASISGSIEMLAGNITEEQSGEKKLINIALREIRRLNNLITDFLEFAKPKDEKADDINLLETISEVMETLQNGAKHRQAPRFLVSVDASIKVRANRERIKQVLFNLFLNSLEASGNRAVTIEVLARPSVDGQVCLDVIDDGPGIPLHLSSRIFDPFFTTKADGTGLGLATVARILKAAKGDIRVVPSVKGAHFQLSVPLALELKAESTAS